MSNEFIAMLHNITYKICAFATTGFQQQQEKAEQTNNPYHQFLRYLYLNLINNMTNSGTSSTSNNVVWRTFKGRLYTRLHDKRVAELDLNGILNVAFLFFVLVKSFSSFSVTILQLKFEQLDSYFRILNVFTKAKNLDKLESSILASTTMASSSVSTLSSSPSTNNALMSKLNALKILTNTKFTMLRLWYDTNELIPDTNGECNIDEIRLITKNDFVDNVNNWIDESAILCKIKMNSESASMSSNQISK
jgi:hypothetical protein